MWVVKLKLIFVSGRVKYRWSIGLNINKILSANKVILGYKQIAEIYDKLFLNSNWFNKKIIAPYKHVSPHFANLSDFVSHVWLLTNRLN